MPTGTFKVLECRESKPGVVRVYAEAENGEKFPIFAKNGNALGLLVLAVREGILPKREAVEVIRLLVENGFRLSDSLIQRAISLLDEV